MELLRSSKEREERPCLKFEKRFGDFFVEHKTKFKKIFEKVPKYTPPCKKETLCRLMEHAGAVTIEQRRKNKPNRCLEKNHLKRCKAKKHSKSHKEDKDKLNKKDQMILYKINKD